MRSPIVTRKALDQLTASRDFKKSYFAKLSKEDFNTLSDLRNNRFELTFDLDDVCVAALMPVLERDQSTRKALKKNYPRTCQQDIRIARLFAEEESDCDNRTALRQFVLCQEREVNDLIQRAYNLHYILTCDDSKEFIDELKQQFYSHEILEHIFYLINYLAERDENMAQDTLLALFKNEDLGAKINTYIENRREKKPIKDQSLSLQTLVRSHPKMGKKILSAYIEGDGHFKFQQRLLLLDDKTFVKAAKEAIIPIDDLVNRICQQPRLLCCLAEKKYLKKLEPHHITQLFSNYVPNTMDILWKSVDAKKLNSKKKKNEYDDFLKATSLEKVTNDIFFGTDPIEQQKQLAYLLTDCKNLANIYHVINDVRNNVRTEKFFTLMDPNNPNVDRNLAKTLFAKFIKHSEKSNLCLYISNIFESKGYDSLAKDFIQLIKQNEDYSRIVLKSVNKICDADAEKIRHCEPLLRPLHHRVFIEMLGTSVFQRINNHLYFNNKLSGELLVSRILDEAPNSLEQIELANMILKPRGFRAYFGDQMFGPGFYTPELGNNYILQITSTIQGDEERKFASTVRLWQLLLVNRIPGSYTAFKFYLDRLSEDEKNTLEPKVIDPVKAYFEQQRQEKIRRSRQSIGLDNDQLEDPAKDELLEYDLDDLPEPEDLSEFLGDNKEHAKAPEQLVIEEERSDAEDAEDKDAAPEEAVIEDDAAPELNPLKIIEEACGELLELDENEDDELLEALSEAIFKVKIIIKDKPMPKLPQQVSEKLFSPGDFSSPGGSDPDSDFDSPEPAAVIKADDLSSPNPFDYPTHISPSESKQNAGKPDPFIQPGKAAFPNFDGVFGAPIVSPGAIKNEASPAKGSLRDAAHELHEAYVAFMQGFDFDDESESNSKPNIQRAYWLLQQQLTIMIKAEAEEINRKRHPMAESPGSPGADGSSGSAFFSESVPATPLGGKEYNKRVLEKKYTPSPLGKEIKAPGVFN